LNWRLRRLPVCGSTEWELERWLRACNGQPNLEHSGLVVLARRQRHGRGQQGRQWVSAPGGLWLSAAFAWPATTLGSGAPLTLAVALGLCLQLEALGLHPQIKWPNDVLIDGRKLAGILPRLRLQGQRVRWAQVGLGLNGINRVPAGAISVAEALHQRRTQPVRRPHSRPFDPRARPVALLPRVLACLDWTCRHATQQQLVLDQVAQRMYCPPGGWPHAGERWQLDGLGSNGELQLRRGGQCLSLHGLELSPAGRA
jgi:BirA family biotin operon repressor/biotin-[acetyl-CoA-carboxylase] ligase